MIYKQIMVAVDGSKSSMLALKESIRLAKDQKAKLLIIHVLDDLYEGDLDRELFVATRKEEGQEILKVMEKTLRHSKVEYEMKLVGLKSSTGRVSEQIVNKAKEWPADLIVIGTHGRQGIHRMFMSSVAEGVIRITDTPVLIIRKKRRVKSH